MVEEEIAARIIKAAVGLDKQLGDLDRAIGGISDDDEREKYRRLLGDLFGQINESFIRPFVRMYRHLEPDP